MKTSLWMITLFSTLSLMAQEIRFGTQDFPPYHFYKDTRPDGPLVDVIKATCQEMGATCSFEILPWKRAQNMARKGFFDALFVMGKNKSRKKWIDFSHPIVKAEYGFFVESSDPLNYQKPQDAQGLKVGVYGPSNTSNNLKKIKAELSGDLQIDMRPDDEPGFKKLAHKRVDAVFSNKHVGEALIRKLNLPNIRYAGQHKTLNYYIGFVKNNKSEKLVQSFNAAYKKLLEKGKVNELLGVYFMESAKLPQK